MRNVDAEFSRMLREYTLRAAMRAAERDENVGQAIADALRRIGLMDSPPRRRSLKQRGLEWLRRLGR